MSDDTTSLNDEDIISSFLDYHTMNIISIYQNLKKRFEISSPFFLANLKSTHLTDLFINLIYYKDTMKYQNPPLIQQFLTEYKQELNISFYIVQNFLKSCNHNLNYNSWCNFCYYKSDLYELMI